MRNKRDMFANGLNRIIQYLFTLILMTILLLCIFSDRITYACPGYIYRRVSIFLLVALGVLLIGCISSVLAKIIKINHPNYIFILVVSLTLLFVQLVVIYSYYFRTDWDPGEVFGAAYGFANSAEPDSHSYYFSLYPNNMMLLFIEYVICKTCKIIGISQASYFAIIIVQCILCWISGLLLFDVSNRIFSDIRLAYLSYILFALLIIFSPWTSIPYSDSMALVFPILELWLFLLNPKNKKKIFLKWFILSTVSYLGYKIKPQTVIMFIAICLIVLISQISLNRIKEKYIAFLGGIIGIAVMMIIVSSALVFIDSFTGIDKEKGFGVAHYLMLGANTDSMGVYADEDVSFSQNFNSISERNEGNIAVWKLRIKRMGVVGVIKQICRKTLTNFNDGTFAWGVDGTFFTNLKDSDGNPFSSFWASLYIKGGKNYGKFCIFEQLLWMGILMCSLIGGLVSEKKKNNSVLFLAVIGITIFETIFEARARYLYCFAPVFILICGDGVKRIFWKKRTFNHF